LEILTIASFLLIFVRRKSKREMRKSMRVSTSTTSEQERSFVSKEEEPESPRDVKVPLAGEKELGGEKRAFKRWGLW
jgi:hypothetical protein